MSEPVETAEEQLREIVRDLEAIGFRLLGVQSSLPPAPMEIVHLLEDETMDRRTEIRTVIGCVLEDFLGPAIRDLRELAASAPTPSPEEEPQGGGDL